MAGITIITMLALLEYIAFGFRVGKARGTYGVNAPATTGDEMFERHYRVHYNTMEQLLVFIPAIWAFGYFVSYTWAGGFGILFLIGRVLYAVQYVKDPASRAPGTLLSMIPSWIMVLGALVGAVLEFI